MPASLLAALAGLLCCLSWPVIAQTPAGNSIRATEIAQCPQGDIVTWQDGIDRPSSQPRWRIAYTHTGAPAWLPERTVRGLIATALEAWSPCGIPMAQEEGPPAESADLIHLDWDEAGSRGNFGLADLGRRRLSLSPAAFALLRERNPAHDARQTLQMVLAHELGHFLGLMAHSRRCVDVLSYYHDGKGGQCLTREPGGIAGKGEFRASLPTACDIARCRALNAGNR